MNDVFTEAVPANDSHDSRYNRVAAEPAKKKRHRRTKAEVEAARAAGEKIGTHRSSHDSRINQVINLINEVIADAEQRGREKLIASLK